METLRLLALLLPMSFSSGINLYATILSAGLAIRYGWISNAPAGLEVLSYWPVIIIAGVFFLLEFFADKIQIIDNIWDFIHTFIRPVGAALLAIAVFGQLDPFIAVIAAMFAGSVALVSHGGKAGSRLALNSLTPMENVTNIAVSAVEDVGAGALTILALKYPYIAAAVGVILLILVIFLVPMFIRFALFSLKSFFNWVKSIFLHLSKRMPVTDELPASHIVQIKLTDPSLSDNLVSGYCQARHLRKFNGRAGYLSVFSGSVVFSTTVGKKVTTWSIQKSEIDAVSAHSGLFLDTMEIAYSDQKQKKLTAGFLFYKDRAVIKDNIQTAIKADKPPIE